jgi:putative FmdB family regulatory protein
MPFFDFKCEKCGHEFGLLVSNQEKSKVKCPQCGHPKVRQLLSPFFTTGSKTPASADPGIPDACRGCSRNGMGCGF